MKTRPSIFFINSKIFYKILCFCLLFYLSFSMFCPTVCKAIEDENNIFLVYDNSGKIIFEGSHIEVGDKIIDTDLREFEIYFIDEKEGYAVADYNGEYAKSKIQKQSKGLFFSNRGLKKNVGLYMTHNDESYVPSDKVSSINGAGGIHDVAKMLAGSFYALGYNTYLDESIHNPHDSSAYNRSSVTAKRLLKNDLDALFDIHRDGVSRSVYVKKVDGIERCKVRIVVGQSNPNKEANLQFALYLVSIAKEYCPWLFLDIFYAKGHYNQALTSKGLLFEMGTYLAEKELVLASTPYLAQVVDKTLFSTIVEDDSSLTIVDEITDEQQKYLVNNVLTNSGVEQSFWSKYSKNIVLFVVLFLAFATMTLVLVYVYDKKRKQKALKLEKEDSKKVTKK